MSGPTIEAERVARRYGRRWALADVSFTVKAGDVLILTGANGSGKTTLLRLLSTVIRPDRGVLRIGGFDARTPRDDIRTFSALLGHASYLYESLTARENLDVFASHANKTKVAILPLLERVGLAARADDYVSTFSAGMRKRLSFARLLLQEPRLALIDEPYGALDPAGFGFVDDLVRDLKARGSTVVMATHQLERGHALGDAFLQLDAGKIVC